MRKYIILIALLLIPFIGCGPVRNHRFEFVSGRTFQEMIQYRKDYLKTQEFSYDNLREYIRLSIPQNKKIVLSQAALETGFFSSDIFYENNNLFGMKQPRVRPNNVQGTNRGHAIYDHWTCSVDDYIMWYAYMTRNKSYKNYFLFLNQLGYAEDGDYIIKLKIIMSMIENDALAYINN